MEDKEIRRIMRKIEAIYRTMNWDNETYQEITCPVSKNSKDSKMFRSFPREKTKDTIKRIFHIENDIFDEKFNQACSGSGLEERRIATLHSSSLCALLFFYNVTKENPLEIEVEGIGNVSFYDVIFEYQNVVIEHGNPSNMDVTLLGEYDGKNVIMFLESKFSEYITGAAKHLKIKNAYLHEEMSCPIYENWPWNKSIEEGKKEFSISVSDEPSYLEGLKQMVSHYVGVRKFERGIYKLKIGEGADLDLHNVKENDEKQKNQVKLRDFALERETLLILGAVVFDVFANDDSHTECAEYETLYMKLMECLKEDAMHCGSNVQIMTKIYTYQKLFEDKKERLTKEIKDFYF